MTQAGYTGAVVCAIPNPHIERWYLADVEAFPQVVGQPAQPAVPRYKCERGRYKRALLEAFRRAGLEPLLGGAEYGEDFAAVMDLYRAGRIDAAFGHFVRDLKAALARFVPETRAR